MLIRFKVGNFLSFNATQELSMISGDTRNHSDHVHKFNDICVLRTSAIYGANASGKSNLIKALDESRMMIVAGTPMRANRYFRPSATNKDRPSYFEFEFENDGKYFSYGFEFLLSKQRIESEWLYGLEPGGDNKIFFQRTGNRITHNFEGGAKTRMDVYAEDMEDLDSTLFLKEMNRKSKIEEGDLSVFSDVFGWFSRKMRVLSAEFFSYGAGDMPENERTKVAELLEGLGTGITDMHYESFEKIDELVPVKILNDIRESLISARKKGSEETVGISLGGGAYTISLTDENELVMKRLVFKHGASGTSFDPEEESEGTMRLYDLLSMMVSETEDSVYILDELDLKLHPQLTFKFLELFLKIKAGTKNQLIFTTHESNLMDFRLLRRDEIWFVQKEDDEGSSLYSLEDFNERTDRKIDKAYLEGRYGGVPVFSTVFPLGGGLNKATRK